MSQQIHQPLHPTLRPLLDPEYVSFHDKWYQYVPPNLDKPWDASIRTAIPPWGSTELDPVEKALTRDISLGQFPIRIFTPDTSSRAPPPPQSGWPVLIWLHGGGWTLGNLSMNNEICHAISLAVPCVVISVGYRLAPEHPYPAALDDALAALKWVHWNPSAPAEMGVEKIDHARVAVGGTSSGGGLAAILSLKAGQSESESESESGDPPLPVCFQLLIVPVIDNTATEETSWASRRHAPWLTPARMKWYREKYLPDARDAERWDASPNFAPGSILARSPRTWVAVAEWDILFEEGKGYAQLLKGVWVENGIEREAVVKVYEGATHTVLSMSGVLEQGRQLVRDAAEQAALWFGED